TTVDNTVDNAISITTGSGATSIDGGAEASPADNDTISVDATALADNTLLTLTGAANFAVTGLKGDLDGSAASGTVSPALADATGISVTTGGGGSTSVDATNLADDHQLTLSGSDNSTVTGLKGDLDASALTGTLDVTTVDNTVDNAISITTGSAATSIDG